MNIMKNKIRQIRDYRLLPDALSPEAGLMQKLRGLKIAVFLDYDGTIVPISENPEKAIVSESMRQTILALSQKTMVAIVSGRNKSNIEELVHLPDIYYVGNHGFDMDGPDHARWEVGVECLPAMEKCFRELQTRLMIIPGVVFELKKLTVTLHYRLVSPKDLPLFFEFIRNTVAEYPSLKLTGGKQVAEIRPNLDWNKGTAVLWLAEKLGFYNPNSYLIYLGDDLSDEDAFALLPDQGAGILVGNHETETYADYHLSDPLQVELFLKNLQSQLS